MGIIFYPGAKVENTAYLPLLEQLERKGYSCYLVISLLRWLNAANKIMDKYPNIKHWHICGHSMIL